LSGVPSSKGKQSNAACRSFFLSFFLSPDVEQNQDSDNCKCTHMHARALPSHWPVFFKAITTYRLILLALMANFNFW